MKRNTLHVSRQFIVAWQFLTAVPLSRVHHDPTPAELALSMRWYPIVGLVLGGALTLGDFLLAPLFARGVVDALLILLLVLLTRGLHQDGLADSLDGLAGGGSPGERLAIMHDSRIGAIGATGLMVALGLRYAGLSALPHPGHWPILICMPAVGRWAMVFGVASAPYARPEGGLGAPFFARLRLVDVVCAAAILAIALFCFLGPFGTLITLVLAGLVALSVGTLACHFFGGLTGDTLGAVNELAETAFLLAGPLLLGLR